MSRLAAVGCAMLLISCAQVPEMRASAIDAKRFQLEGRLSLRQGETASHFGISWRHQPDGDEVFLTGPLGQGIAELRRDAAGARLTMPDRRIVEAGDWEGLAERVLGVRVPLNELPRWVVGASSQTAPAGWRIDYLESRDGLPVLMEFHRGDLDLRLKVDAWSVPSP